MAWLNGSKKLPCVKRNATTTSVKKPSPGPEEHKLRYKKPARTWTEALPIGNGRLGAMVFGGVAGERLQLNESSLVSGYPGYRNLPLDARKDYAAITAAIAAGRYVEATRLVESRWLGACWACYQPLGDLVVDFPKTGSPRNYERELDIAKGIFRVSYESGGARFTREIFASHPDEVIVLRFASDKAGRLDFRVRFGSPHPVEVRAGGARLSMHGQAPGFVLRRTLEWVEERGDTWKYPELWDEACKRLPGAAQVLYNGRGMFFSARLSVQTRDGEISATGDSLTVCGASETVILLAASTSYNGFDKDPVSEGADAGAKAERALKRALKRDSPTLLKRHTTDHRGLFDRVTLDLGPGSGLPTDQRLKEPGPALAALYFQFGRYLLIAGSRANGQPLNLQGLWNEEIIPPWSGQYTLNINAEMNYWPAAVCNLSECAEPFHRMIRELAVDGRRVAREMYGRRGWVAHHNTTLWREAQPVDNTAVAAYWPLGGAWLCVELFDHYRFGQDLELLREAWPLMKEACLFLLDWIVPNAEGRLVTPVSTSPENTFHYKADEKEVIGSISAGSTMDMGIIRELFRNTAEAAAILGIEDGFRRKLKAAAGKLPAFRIGARGQLQEWQEDLMETEPDHRHVSHLFALHPAAQITPRGTPELAAAARKTLELRGDGGTGWSKAWKISFWARLGDGDHADKMLEELLKESTLPNLFDTCPPFQIDGNFGGAAGIAEMLLQSHDGEIELLPALPCAWPSGSVRGLRARGGYEVAIQWSDGCLEEAEIRASRDGACRARLGGKVRAMSMKAGERLRLDGNLKRRPKLPPRKR